MTTSQAFLVLIICIIVVVFILIYKGQYKPPSYPGFGR